MNSRKKSLLNLIGAGLIAAGSLGLLGGCGTIYENEPVVRDIIDNTVPSALQPNSIKDARERMKSTENTYDKNCINVVIEKEGYTMSKEICEYDEVFYKNKSHRVWSITPPYIEISERHTDRAIVSSRSESFRVKITDLDMFKK